MTERQHEDMTKRPSLFAAKSAAPIAEESTATPPVMELPATLPAGGKRPPSRAGKRVLSVYLDPIAWKQLRQLALDTDTSTQALGEEAINLLFEKHRMNRSA
jgi:antitoxin-like ribbon-helix-helix protein